MWQESALSRHRLLARPCLWVTIASLHLFCALGGALEPMVVCPSTLAAGQVHTCFVSGPLAPPSRVELLRKSSSEVVVSGLPVASSPGLYTLALPSNLAPGEYTVQVTGASGEAPKKAYVEVTGEAALVLLEADKALYKPGQTALFRALALQPATLKPLAGRQVRFAVVSPQGFKLLQSQNATDTYGVARFNLPIADEPLLGAHTARATIPGSSGGGAVHEVGFTIQEYVLPRFEVALALDQTYLAAPTWQESAAGTVTVSGRVTATYTYGEGVAGQVLVTALNSLSSPWPSSMSSSGPSRSDAADAGGAAGYRAVGSTSGVPLVPGTRCDFRVTIQRSELRAGSPLLLEASVLDAATGERQNATAIVPVTYAGDELYVHLEAVDGSDVFKPGLPASVRVQLKLPGGAAAGSDQLAAGGPLHLVAERRLVSWAAMQPTSVTVELLGADFASGAAVVEVPIALDDARCCDPLAIASTEQEYTTKMVCCTSSVNLYVTRAGVGLYSSGATDMVPTLCLSRAYSPTGHFLAVAPPDAQSTTRVRATMDFAELQGSADYIITHGGAVSGGGSAAFAAPQFRADGKYWEATLPVQVPSAAAGACKLVVVARLPSGAALTGSAAFTRDLAWPFSLTTSFSQGEVQPGANVSVRVEAGGVAVGAPVQAFITSLDRSAELLGARASISAVSVLAGFKRAGAGGSAEAVQPRVWQQCQRHGLDAPVVGELGAAVALLSARADQAAPGDNPDAPYGPSLGSNCPRPIANACSQGGVGGAGGVHMVMEMAGPVMAANSVAAKAPESNGGAAAAVGGRAVAVRKFFPETWLWHDFSLAAGAGAATATFAAVAPDSITTWSLEAFATSPDGIAAVRSETPLRVFRPFFVEARLPYSAIRGEELEVVLAVYNYAEGSGSVRASLEVVLPTGLELVNGSLLRDLTVPEGSAASATISVRPSTLASLRFEVYATGTKAGADAADLADALERTLLVRPEGFEVRSTRNVVMELSDAKPSTMERVEMQVPAEAVNGSAYGTVSVVGDLLGPTISGLDRLLQIPTGCGEQNMITLAPNVYVGKYLISVGRMRPDLRERITTNLLVGYGRELTYRHSDGSFSAFGSQDTEGSTWLTAFVLKTFAEVQALGLIAVDGSVLESAAAWLVAQQAADGSFQQRGNVIHREMMGGLGDAAGASVALAAYVAGALAKARAEMPSLQVAGLQPALQRAASFLDAASVSRTYPKLLRSYALFLAGLQTAQAAAAAVLALSQVGTTAGQRYWTGGDSASSAQDVELTGYGVLVLSLAGQLGEAFQGARWLLQRRSASGGFSSTQDTVIALGALATYAAKVAGTVDVEVHVQGGGGLNATMTVDDSNIDVLQTVELPTPGAAVEIQATGTGMALAVVELVYNVPTKPADPCYELQVQWFQGEREAASLAGAVRGCVQPRANCTTRAPGGMWLLSIGLFTGYSASDASLVERRAEGVVKRYEVSESKVDFYLEDVAGDDVTCVEFNVMRDFAVNGLQATTSEVYEYYAPERRGAALTAYSVEEYVAAPGRVRDVGLAPHSAGRPPWCGVAVLAAAAISAAL